MRVTLSAHRPFHFVMLANALRAHARKIDIFSSAPRRFFKGLDETIPVRMAPAPIHIVSRVLPFRVPHSMVDLDTLFYDALVAARMGRPDICFGLATQSLYTARAAKSRGGAFVLDRACPHRDFQQALGQREAERVGIAWQPQPEWFRERQLEEYDLAEAILVPSMYTGRTFPAELQHKLVKAPLLGRTKIAEKPRTEKNSVFTVGVVGGAPLRKGYLYLLKAWKKLALPNAKLLIRSGGGFAGFPALEELMKQLPNVELVGYVPNISEFYQRCDAFVLPSVDDGFGMALVEAMSNYVACVASSNCGASEFITSGRDGIVVEPASEDQLAEGILRLYESEELRREMGAAAVETVRKIEAGRGYDRAIDSLMSRLGSDRLAVNQLSSQPA
ncbi:glycosyltransferase [Paracidobacterium acidisoli]|uniref:Glycosyltransferase n=1 Tax=Paracidobacterium acidisoli TaxID=2303751 RepID=A0A372IT11_9BACT|nr:glycosyltransferase [Paracidobacterium acidisoli]MBT9330458.1 glycosyltransferase [Paracidobacterium acidisoli]